MTKQPTIGPKNNHKISWPMKLAFALAFLPFIWLILALALKLPLPTAPFINLSGNEIPEYVIFMTNTANNLTGSVYFVLACFTVGIGLFSYLALDKGSIKNAWQDVAKTLKEDFASLLKDFTSKLSGDNKETTGQTKKPNPSSIK